ncbi:hypothetical protein FB45DRAFT_870876 [Roridomyces roridus]|uniref:Uncharacterized protein n=1 Tax=Roridomyces roridus TaxID=1738132 RepID=A0AAD7BHD0_9AGAR|nr:hypothetical protein FB45DRAFT_870876 [Roridomyces roridus]
MTVSQYIPTDVSFWNGQDATDLSADHLDTIVSEAFRCGAATSIFYPSDATENITPTSLESLPRPTEYPFLGLSIDTNTQETFFRKLCSQPVASHTKDNRSLPRRSASCPCDEVQITNINDSARALSSRNLKRKRNMEVEEAGVPCTSTVGGETESDSSFPEERRSSKRQKQANFICECGTTFGRVLDRRRHKKGQCKLQPRPLREKPRCEYCRETFSRKDAVPRHQNPQYLGHITCPVLRRRVDWVGFFSP